ncbi:MAG TPA: cell division protein ZapA [Novosphingobium sp.]|nr:cell division protein ZapA [Novosphingobium sp.]
MSGRTNVELSIGGRTFVVACADGEEAHISGLGEIISGKLDGFGDTVKLGETRMLLYAALFLADELQDARTAGWSGGAPARDDDRRLDAVASRLEAMAAKLEGAAGTGA